MESEHAMAVATGCESASCVLGRRFNKSGRLLLLPSKKGCSLISATSFLESSTALSLELWDNAMRASYGSSKSNASTMVLGIVVPLVALPLVATGAVILNISFSNGALLCFL